MRKQINAILKDREKFYSESIIVFENNIMDIQVNKLQKILNIKFNNTKLLIQSMTHKSYNSEINYEKLEFLGDRVLGLIISNPWMFKSSL